MRMYDVISHKKSGIPLTNEEIRYFVDGFTRGDIPDYQASALLMAITLNGMDERETVALTESMAKSGDMVDLSSIPGVKVDKHSTGGVGDKTSLIIGPIVASCGIPVAKMSGRALGYSGGTIDKLESIPGYKTALEPDNFFSIVREIGISIISQSGDITPADKKLYALRDVTATVESIPLIASSIMSKKIAAGSDAILLDVKAGGGAFMKSLDDSIALAEAMVSIGFRSGRSTMALVTNMDVPLGNAIGNSLEVAEAVETLRGNGPGDLTDLCIVLSSYMLLLASASQVDIAKRTVFNEGFIKDSALQDAVSHAKNSITSGRAFDKLCCMVEAQGGDVSVLLNGFPKSSIISPIMASKSGFISRMDTEAFGLASLALGAGRTHYDDSIDYSAGILLNKKTGDCVAEGDALAFLHTSDEKRLSEAEHILSDAYIIGGNPPPAVNSVLAIVSKSGTEIFQPSLGM